MTMKKIIARSVILLLLNAITLCRAATLTVTSTADSGVGTLRQAILDANADTSPDDVAIEFNIPGPGVQTIAPLSGLPAVTRTVTIGGYTQPGASPNTLANSDNAVLLIELSGANLSAGSIGLLIKANDCTVRGLVINRFTAGIWVDYYYDNAVIEGNFMGTDATGTTALPNFQAIVMSGSGHRVGGLTPGSRNIVSGNVYGMSLGTRNEVFGNYVGVGSDGATAVPNTFGIFVHNTSQNRIGGPAPGARNVISANANGIWINNFGGNFIQGNFIGTDASGTLRRGNSSGIVLNEAPHTLIGGTGAGEGNLISGNLGQGVAITGFYATSNVVAGNLIGTDVTGTITLGNGNYGVSLGSMGNRIGGSNSNARNVITGSGTGVFAGAGSTKNAVLGNSIFGNGIGIDLGSFSPASFGPTPNDASDADDGANHYQNFPDITSVKLAGRNLKVDYLVDSAAANSVYPLTVEFFIADGDQGRTFIHRVNYSTPQAAANIVFKPAVLPAVGDQIVSTATDANGNTSEFSTPIAVTRNGQGGN